MTIDFNTIKTLYLANNEVEELYINGSKVWQKSSGLTFTAEEANSTVAMTAVGSAPSVSLEYSTNNGSTWNDFIVGITTVALPNIGDQVVIRAKTTNNRMGSGTSTYNRFVMTGKIAASDSIMYLLKNDGDLNSIASTYCFTNLFRDCSSLTQAPELPATSLTKQCYSLMFQNCIALTSAPELPATTLADQCYYGMFQGCTSLTEAPELPETTLRIDCYYGMFQGCTSLTEAPELPATTLRVQCYQYMFAGCSSLATAPELPATTLNQYCYANMFQGCTSLTTAPALPATTLANSCYRNMFYGCSSLNSIEIAYTGNFSGTGVPSEAFLNWVQDVSASGTFYYDGEDTTTGNSAIPTGWTVKQYRPGVEFTANTAGSTISMARSGNAPSVDLLYSTDGYTWNTFMVGSTTITLANVGDKVWFKAGSNGNTSFGSSESNYNKFVMTGEIEASNSIMYLLDENGSDNATLDDYCFYRLFEGCASLTTTPDLSGIVIGGDYSCKAVFKDCTSLTSVSMPNFEGGGIQILTNLVDGCTSLTTLSIPKYSYGGLYSMNSIVRGCSSLDLVDISQATDIPTLTNLDAFQNTNSTYRVVVPDSLFDQWRMDWEWYHDDIVGHIYKASAPTTSVPLPEPTSPASRIHHIYTNNLELDTGYYPNATTYVVMKEKGTADGDRFVGFNDNDNADWRLFNANNNLYMDVGSSRVNTTNGSFNTGTVVMYITGGNLYLALQNGNKNTTTYGTSVPSGWSTTETFKIGKSGRRFDLYSLSIWEKVNGKKTCLKNYVPAFDDNGVACLWDSINDTFNYPSGGSYIGVQ